jgi:hypothetical protein
MKTFILIAFPLLVLLNIFDVYSTQYVLQFGAEEANPFMLMMMELFGVLPGMILTKGVFFVLLTYLCIRALYSERTTKRELKFVTGGLAVLVFVYSYIMIFHNYPLLKLV